MFITLEGVEACGKSTQAKLLKEYFLKKGKKVFLTKEPGGFPFSEKLRDLLLHNKSFDLCPKAEFLLFSASRAEHTHKYISKYLAKNYIVICDRYTDSSLAYQGFARGLSIEDIQLVNDFSSDSLTPKFTFYISIPIELSIKRLSHISKDKIEKENFAFHKALENGFNSLYEKNKKRIIKIDGKLPIKQVHNQIVSFVN